MLGFGGWWCGIADVDWPGGREDWIGRGGPHLSACHCWVDGEWRLAPWTLTYPPSSRNG